MEKNQRTNEELAEAISKVLDTDVTVREEWDGRLVFKIRDYSSFGMNFAMLMKVADALGTLDVDINDEHIQGHRYSEYTCDPDEYIREFRVDKDKIDSGLPWRK